MKKAIPVIITLIVAIILTFVFGNALENKPVFDTASIEYSYEEVIPTDETVRIIGGTKYGNNQIIDESGNLWDVENEELTAEDNLLLWISDNGTEQIEDDIIIKVWKEA